MSSRQPITSDLRFLQCKPSVKCLLYFTAFRCLSEHTNAINNQLLHTNLQRQLIFHCFIWCNRDMSETVDAFTVCLLLSAEQLSLLQRFPIWLCFALLCAPRRLFTIDNHFCHLVWFSADQFFRSAPRSCPSCSPRHRCACHCCICLHRYL